MNISHFLAFVIGAATPILAWQYSTDKPDYDNKDVSLMADGTVRPQYGAFDGERVRGLRRVMFYIRHPKAPRPRGSGDLWVWEKLPMPKLSVYWTDGKGKEQPAEAYWTDGKGNPLH